MEAPKFELDDRSLNISINGNHDEFEASVNKFIEGYLSILNTSGNTLYYTTGAIFPLLNRNCLWGEALHLFIELMKERDQTIPVGRILKDIFLTNLRSEDEEDFIIYSTNKGLKILEGLRIVGQDYLAYKLLQIGQGKVVYNSIVKFLLSYKEWKRNNEEKSYLKEEFNDSSIDEDLLYWLDVADGEATSDIPPSERSLYELDFIDLDEFKPVHENQSSVIAILTRYIDLILEAKRISFKKKMALTDLYNDCIFSRNSNSNLLYGQLQLVLHQVKTIFSTQNIDLKFIKETVNDFYNCSEIDTFEICRIDFDKKNSYVIFANFENGLFNTVHLKKSDNNLAFLSFEDPQYKTENISEFIDLLLQDIHSQYSFDDIKTNVSSEEKRVEEIYEEDNNQSTPNAEYPKLVKGGPLSINDEDLPW